MIPTQTLSAFPEFGNSSTKVKPDDTKYSAGFVNADVVPYEWVNYLHNKASVGITDLNSGVSSMEKELNAVVTAGGATPSESSNNQVLNAINYLIAQAKSEAILAAHPIGSLYWSSKDTNPNLLFGGTWTRIKDKFILAAGDTYTNGATGGSASAQLTVSNLPSHSHSFTPSGSVSVSSHTHGLNGHTHSFTPSGSITMSAHSHGLNNHTHSFSATTGIPSKTLTLSAVCSYDGAHWHFFNGDDGSGSESSAPGASTGLYPQTVDSVKNVMLNGTNLYNYNNSFSSQTAYYPYNSTNYNNRVRLTIDGEGTGHWQTTKANYYYTAFQFPTSWSGYHSHSVTLSQSGYSDHTHYVYGMTGSSTGNNSGTTQNTITTGSFTGTASITDGNSGNTTATAPTGSFTGSAGITGATGDSTSFSILPPYLVKYCWERTA